MNLFQIGAKTTELAFGHSPSPSRGGAKQSLPVWPTNAVLRPLPLAGEEGAPPFFTAGEVRDRRRSAAPTAPHLPHTPRGA